MEIKSLIREVPDYPIPGVQYKDITPLLADPSTFAEAVSALVDWVRPLRPDIVVAPEARGYIAGSTLAHGLGCGFVPARRPGKLPAAEARRTYELEYGVGTLELPTELGLGGARIVIHDDVLAVGGTTRALIEMLNELGGVVVGATYLAEIAALGAREKLRPIPVYVLATY